MLNLTMEPLKNQSFDNIKYSIEDYRLEHKNQLSRPAMHNCICLSFHFDLKKCNPIYNNITFLSFFLWK